jgi:immune inhibitor A
VVFHKNGVPIVMPSRAAMSTFNDTNPMRYWSADNPGGSVQVAGTGTIIKVTSQDPTRGWPMKLNISFK